MYPYLLLLPILLLIALVIWYRRQTHDLSQQVQAQNTTLEHCQHEQENLAQTLDMLGKAVEEALLQVDDRARVIWASQSAQPFLLPHLTLPADLHEALQVPALITMATQTLQDHRSHARQFHWEDRVFWAQAMPWHQGAILTIKDVSELQRLGRARRDFVANISHDLRTPITTIQLLVETLQAGAIEKPKKRKKLLESIADQTLSLQQLAQELMDLSLIESGRMPLRLIPTPLSPIIEPPIARLEAQIAHKNLHLHRAYDPNLVVLADVEPMQRVIQNLLHNAIKFTPDQGHITIGARADDSEVTLYVQDSGPGIPPEHIHRIFERFYKAESSRTGSGSGLGLAIARHIVEGHGGRIWAESQPGQGATFYFTLLKDPSGDE